jgi:hypothetical protein
VPKSINLFPIKVVPAMHRCREIEESPVLALAWGMRTTRERRRSPSGTRSRRSPSSGRRARLESAKADLVLVLPRIHSPGEVAGIAGR